MLTESNPMFVSMMKTLFSSFSTLNLFLAKLAKTCVAAMLAVNLAIVFAGVVFRYLFNQPLGWVYEVAIFLMMWSAFVGSAVLSHDNAHVSLDFLISKFSGRLRYLITLAMEIAAIILIVTIIHYSVTMMLGLLSSRSSYLRLPMYWVYSSVPVGMGMVLLQQIEQAITTGIKLFKGKTTVLPHLTKE